MNKFLLPFLLFLAFLAYRLHFWDYSFTLHPWLNATADVLISVPCGFLIFKISERYSSHQLLFLTLVTMGLFTLVLFYCHKIVYHYTNMFVDDFQYMFNTLCFQFLDSFSIVITGSLVSLLSLISNEKNTIEKNLEAMAVAKDKEELKYLKTKLNPHFIFNGLNSIYHEIDDDKNAAKVRLIQFSDIVRYHLKYASEEKVDFDVEVGYLKSYIKFQYQSTSDFLKLEQDYQIEDTETEIAPLLFIPFLENAFKYCSSSSGEKGKMSVDIKFNKASLFMKVVNTYDPVYRKQRPSNGFGLRNVKKRLNLHYPGKYNLQIDDLDQERIYQCQLNIVI